MSEASLCADAPAIPTPASTAAALVATLATRGTRRIWGVPGGGSSLDLIREAAPAGLHFVLCRHEGSAAMMATADAELSGAPGVVLTTKGPGLSNALNGVSCATLERAPVLLVSDGFTPSQTGWITHQVFDQRLATTAYVKAHARCEGDDPGGELKALLDAACAHPRGAVHLDLTSAAAKRPARRTGHGAAKAPPLPDIAALRARLAASRRPVMLLGLEATEAAPGARALAEALGCPVLVTYKAKGVLPDAHPQHAGIFTGGTLEAQVVGAADLILLVGADPVEFILQPWRYTAPVAEIAARSFPVHYTPVAVGAYGPVDAIAAVLAADAQRSAWTTAEIGAHRAAMRDALAWPAGGGGVAPPRIVQLAAEAATRAGRDPRASVDAGAHMFSATAFWPCSRPRDLLISNGLATMGFALPAGIAAALHDPSRGAVAFTGDGGLMMCVAELATAADHGARLVTIVFNDGALSLIDVKQQQRQLPSEGVRWGRTDFAMVAEGFGARGFRATDETTLAAALDAAFAHDGPSLVDVQVDPAGYMQQLQAMRG
ncbi:thiamine pyrophosphate-binding protein [Roseomonas fluvialis]|uniref:Acetolactate synthase n=1 Tax=Roseomonas fluvialis TaxID=1750527 RepID=A0ABM7Y0G3_9PROT|nr:thiamine pyrophosphate-dependent enzyme [Roseomonas fluvialis]BDG71232.1 acetolactate synthase [Roseomonas fluvialis]